MDILRGMGDSTVDKTGRAQQRQLIQVVRDDAAGELAIYSDDNEAAGLVALVASSKGLTARRFRSSPAEIAAGRCAIKMVVRDERTLVVEVTPLRSAS